MLGFLGGGGLRVYYVTRGEGVPDFTQPTTIGGRGYETHKKSYYVIYEQPLTGIGSGLSRLVEL
jgi:hypothetical protein